MIGLFVVKNALIVCILHDLHVAAFRRGRGQRDPRRDHLIRRAEAPVFGILMKADIFARIGLFVEHI